MAIVVNGKEYAAVHGGTGFNPLPVEERGHGAADDLCCCPWCSPESGRSVDNPEGVWDTLATSLETGATWKVHYPSLHGRVPLREEP